jgi:hypothetical protein
MSAKLWPPEMIERLKALVAEKKLSGGEIAEVLAKEFREAIAMIGLNLNRNSIAGQVRQAGLKLESHKHGRKRSPSLAPRRSPERAHIRRPRLRKPRFGGWTPETTGWVLPEPEVVTAAPPPPPEPEDDLDTEEVPEIVIATALTERYSAKDDHHRNTVWIPPAEADARVKRDLKTEVSATAVDLYHLTKATCRWPVQSHPTYLFCGAERLPGTSYCAQHFRRSVALPASRRRGFLLPHPRP